MENNNQQSATAAGYPYHHLDQQQQQQLEMFWSFQRQEIDQANDFKNHQLPFARIKKIMKANKNVQKISAEAPILFAKACDLFIQELTIRSWFHAEENKRHTLQKDDIAAAITQNDVLGFLFDVVHSDEFKEQATGLGASGMVGAPASGIPYYYPQPDNSGVMMGSGIPNYYPHPNPSGLMMGRSRVSPSVYVQPTPPPPQGWQSVWQSAEDNASGGNSGQGKLDGQS